MLLKLIPEEHAGQFFGLHSLTGRLGTIVGPAAWGFIADDMFVVRPGVAWLWSDGVGHQPHSSHSP